MEEILLCNVCMHLTNVRIVRGILWFHKIKIRKLNFALVIWRTFVRIQNLPNFSSEYSSFIRWKIFLSSYERTFVTWKIFHQTKVGLDWCFKMVWGLLIELSNFILVCIEFYLLVTCLRFFPPLCRDKLG